MENFPHQQEYFTDRFMSVITVYSQYKLTLECQSYVQAVRKESLKSCMCMHFDYVDRTTFGKLLQMGRRYSNLET